MFYGYNVTLDNQHKYTVAWRDGKFDYPSILILWNMARNKTQVTLNYDS